VSVREWAQGGRFGSILQAAPSEGCDAIIQQLLEAGVDVNVQDGWRDKRKTGKYKLALTLLRTIMTM
jgi:hypothetical protein